MKRAIDRRRIGLVAMLLAVGLMAARPAAVQAAGEAKDYAGGPVAVVALPSYDSLMSSAGFIGKLVDRPALPQMLEGGLSFFTQGKGLAGLDKSRPLGMIFQFHEDSDKPEPLGFIPVKSLKELLTSFEGLTGGPIDPDDDGVYSLQLGPRPVYLVEKGKWAYFARKPEFLSGAPADPLPLLDGIEKDYNVGVRVFVRNVPEEKREQAIKELQEGIKAGLKKQEDEKDDEYETRRKIAESSQRQMIRLIEETDHVTLGWKLDETAGTSHVDLSVVALPGTKLAEQSKSLAEAKSRFTGFLQNDAAIYGAFSATMKDKEEIGNLSAVIDAARGKIFEKIDEDKNKGEDARAKSKEIVGELIDVVRETAATGKFDGGFAVKLTPGNMTVALGGAVADGAKLEAALKKLAAAAEQQPKFDGVEWDVDKQSDVRLHKFHLPVQDDKAKDVLGDPLEVILGIGEKSFFLAFGREPLPMLKSVIQKSDAAGEKPVPPLQGALSVGKLTKFAAERDDDPGAKAVATALEGEEQDHVRLTAEGIEGGMRYRLEVEKGVLKAIGKAANAGMGKRKPAGF